MKRITNCVKRIVFSILYNICITYQKLKWHPWNPWSVARLNLARTKYMETTMYRDRTTAFGHEWAMEAYVEYKETLFFVSMLTRRERLKQLFAPFSCGDHYRLPWWQLGAWILGVKPEE